MAVANGKILLVLRDHPPEAGRWSVPGGRLERGETIAQAVVRELSEETGLTGKCGELIGWVERIGSSYHYVILDFAVELDPGPQPRAGGDARDARWYPLEQLESLDLVGGLYQFFLDHGVLPP